MLDSRADLGSPASDLPLDVGNSAFLRGGGGRRDGEMVRGGEKRHFFPLTSLQIGYVFRRIFSPVLGISCAVDARLTAMRLPASGGGVSAVCVLGGGGVPVQFFVLASCVGLQHY